jgi:hypothetical protein
MNINIYKMNLRDRSIENASKFISCIGFIIPAICLTIKKIFTRPKIHPVQTDEGVVEVVTEDVTEDVTEVVTDNPRRKQILLNWTSSTLTYGPYHWWPWKEATQYHSKKQIDNNLYAESGPLDKYDYLFSSKALEYQKKHYFRKWDSAKSDANWAGFCDKASILSCLWEYPKHNVNVCYNNKSIEFTTSDIEGLMILVTNNTITNRQSFYGERYNDHYFEDQFEPYPSKLLHILHILCSENTPFCVDISNDASVWNYPMSSVHVTKYTQKPEKTYLYSDDLPLTGQTDYYEFILSSKAYPDKKQHFWGWVNHTNNQTKEGWFSKHTPDFLWKTYKKRGKWTGISLINPEINCSFVYSLYQASFTDNAQLTL